MSTALYKKLSVALLLLVVIFGTTAVYLNAALADQVTEVSAL
jgi:hypothetical protein